VRIGISPLENCYGHCFIEQREIRIDIDRHDGNDREIRSTLLHEMCHVAAGPHHNSRFFLEIERLLRQKAPITLSFSETDGLQIVKNAPRPDAWKTTFAAFAKKRLKLTRTAKNFAPLSMNFGRRFPDTSSTYDKNSRNILWPRRDDP